LLLLHGQGACADWWSFIAPFLCDRFRVTALSWSGMGRSQWRAAYDFDVYSREIFAVARACGQFDSPSRPIVIAHSFGGIPLIYAAKSQGGDLGGAIVIDCFFRHKRESAEHEPGERGDQRAIRSPGQYATLSEALARFRLEPRQGCVNLFIIDYIARHSLMQTTVVASSGECWRWRFDPDLRLKTRKQAIAPYLSDIGCPLILMSGDRSNLVTSEFKGYMSEIAPLGTPWITIPDSGHHVMLDQPLVLSSTLNGILSIWPPRQ